MLRLRTALLLGIVAAVCTATALPAAAERPSPQDSSEENIREYYDSGEFDEDATHILRNARRSLKRQLEDGRRPRRSAIVLDIDDTALWTYPCQRRQGEFGSAELAVCVAEAGVSTQSGGKGLPRIGPVYRFFRLALRRNVRIFFITGRPDFTRDSSRQNLQARGYDGYDQLITQPNDEFAERRSLIPYKSGARAKIERRGHEILVNVGDQRSDLKGGHANKRYKVPNPMYFTP